MASSNLVKTSSNLVKVYNKYLIDLILERKTLETCTLRDELRRLKMSAIDPASEEYIKAACEKIPVRALIDSESPLTDPSVLDYELLQGVPLKHFVTVKVARKEEEADQKESAEKEEDDKEEDAELLQYVYTQVVLALAYLDGTEALASSVVNVLSSVQKGDDVEEAMHGILDVDIQQLLLRLKPAHRDANAGGSLPFGIDPNGKIASIATEITRELEESDLLPDDPKELFNFAALGKGNNALANIVSKVGNKFKEKMESGDIKQEDLISEAMGFLGMFNTAGGPSSPGEGGGGGGNEMFTNIMKMASSMMQQQTNPKTKSRTSSSISTRDRLKKKLADRMEKPDDP